MSLYALKGRVIDAISDKALEDGLVLIDGERITYAGDGKGVEIAPQTEVISIPDGTILPGFIDCHAHLTGGESVNNDPYAMKHFDLLLTTAHDIGILQDAGFTSLREMGAFGIHLKKAIQRGILRGPRIMTSYRLLGVTGGHVDDDSDLPLEVRKQTNLMSRMVDGVEDCLRGTREQFRMGAEFIKICATGGVSSTTDGVDDVQFSFEEVKAIVDEAKRHGTYVAAHCTGNAGTLQALQAGVLSIEHGDELDERCIELMIKQDATLVTTLSIALGIPKWKDSLPKHIYEKGCKLAESAVRSAMLARSAGIRIALGTDYSNSKNTPYANNGKEFASIVEAGFTPLEAIKIGTVNGAHLMKNKKTGSLEKGKLADVVVVGGNPLQDINLIADARHVKLVFQNGALVKDARKIL
jgi:imidazolonepropionase-like amidohydrolase